MTFASGTRLGPYEIVSALDLAGLGEVYRARDHEQQRDVSFRVLRAGFAVDPERLKRFEQEARAAIVLSHPNILTVYDIGTDAQAAYIVSEPLDGKTLREVLDAGALPVGTVIQYAVQVAQGLAAAHEKGIVHRDLKPENILIAMDGRVKVLGFGLATVTQSESALAGLKGSSDGVALGAPGYMSPEQSCGVAADPRSDMFTFGAIVYEMLSGARAFSGETPVETMTAVLKSDPPKLQASDIPPMLARTVDLCLKKHPGSRPAASDVVGVLYSLGSQQASVAPSVVPPLAPAIDGVAPIDVATPYDVAAPRQGRRVGRIAAVLGILALAALEGPWLLRVVRGPSTASRPSAATPAPRSSTPLPPARALPPATPLPPVTALPRATPGPAASAQPGATLTPPQGSSPTPTAPPAPAPPARAAAPPAPVPSAAPPGSRRRPAAIAARVVRPRRQGVG